MPAKKSAKKVVKKVAKSKPPLMFAGTGVFGWMMIGLAVGGLIVLLRYILISWMVPAEVYLIEPSMLVPGMGN
jgi:hypothetical protein